LAGREGEFMDKDKEKTWRPHLDTLPLFNPFEPSTKWTAQIGADDEIKVEDEAASPDSESADSPTEKIHGVK
jgi:hypothetical protein